MTDSPANRYDRQIRFASLGQAGHDAIRSASVSVLGCGALGTVAAEILTRAGVGRIQLIDRDLVEWSNLQRQSLFNESDANDGVAKAEAAARHLKLINSDVDLLPVVADVNSLNISNLLSESDIVIDAVDNFFVRFVLNDWSLANGKPWVHGGCVGASGQVHLFSGSGWPCFRCLVPTIPPPEATQTCDSTGVLGSATHVIASLQTTEALKWISGNRESLRDKLLSVDLWNNRIREMTLTKDLSTDCEACRGKYDFLNSDADSPNDTTVLCGRGAVQLSSPNEFKISLTTLAERWRGLGDVQSNPFFTRLRLSEDANIQLTLFRDGRVIVDGTEDPSRARILRDRLLG